VNYDEQHWLRLIKHLTSGNFSEIHEINRAALIDDLMNLGRADYISYATVISATMYLKWENNYLPWRAFYNNLPYLSNRFRGRHIEDLYKVRMHFVTLGTLNIYPEYILCTVLNQIIKPLCISFRQVKLCFKPRSWFFHQNSRALIVDLAVSYGNE